MTPDFQILVAGIGNIFHGDDAFGVELAQRLMRRRQPASVKVADFGIRSIDLAFALLDSPAIAILLDATARGGKPGTLYTIEIDPNDSTADGSGSLDAHSMNPMRVLDMVRTLGGTTARLLLVGCEPRTLGSEEDGALGLSDEAEEAVERGVGVVEALIASVSEEFPKERLECPAPL